MEEPRLVHLRLRGHGIGSYRRRGTLRNGGRRLLIDGKHFEQVPVFFFVTHECTYWALRFYTIRFSVASAYSPNPMMTPIKLKNTNLVMSPNDILVSWHTEQLLVSNSRFSHF
ncbi:hypothetical protein F5B18DRAFT_636588 [Nemania serpens]|nr:hypothetical protein F5B18DRAFT_636588 [Nemania serpens]